MAAATILQFDPSVSLLVMEYVAYFKQRPVGLGHMARRIWHAKYKRTFGIEESR